MTISPYALQPIERWSQITNTLIAKYPLSVDEILNIATLAWDNLWSSLIGGDIPISEVDLPANVVGYFFQKLFAHELSKRYPEKWRGEKLKSDKDLVNLEDEFYSTEMKSSGQLGYKLFGNRSYNQESLNSSPAGKDKSGYYITINFYKQNITLLRIGWIDQEDWIPQSSATGQAAILKAEVYDNKLQIIKGPYLLHSPVELLHGVGDSTLAKLHTAGVYTFKDIISYQGSDSTVNRIKNRNQHFLDDIST